MWQTKTIRRAAARGMTLIEVTVSTAVISVVITAAAMAIMLATRALPSRANAAVAVIEQQHALDVMLDELRYARTVTVLSASRFSLTVADRNGDGVDETIRYAWSRVAGHPLLVRYNNEAQTAVVQGVEFFGVVWRIDESQGEKLLSNAVITCRVGGSWVVCGCELLNKPEAVLP